MPRFSLTILILQLKNIRDDEDRLVTARMRRVSPFRSVIQAHRQYACVCARLYVSLCLLACHIFLIEGLIPPGCLLAGIKGGLFEDDEI